MSTRPMIEITPSPAEYRRLLRDLEALREAGAPTNTAAILEAVHRAADTARESRMDASSKTAGHRANGPGPATGGKS